MSDQVDTDQDVGYYVYGIVPAEQSLPDLRGIDDAPVELVTLDDLAAVVSRFTLDRPAGRRAELVAHSRVVDALAEAGAVVPVQFGSVLEHDSAAVEDLLADQSEVARATLERVSGKVQMNLRVSYVEERVLEEVVRESPRVAELRRRTRDLPEGAMHPDLIELGELVSAGIEAKAAQDAETVFEALEAHPVEVVERAGGSVDVVDLALLVPSDETERLEQTLEQYAEQTHERLRWRLVGPVAPYDFTEDVAWD